MTVEASGSFCFFFLLFGCKLQKEKLNLLGGGRRPFLTHTTVKKKKNFPAGWIKFCHCTACLWEEGLCLLAWTCLYNLWSSFPVSKMFGEGLNFGRQAPYPRITCLSLWKTLQNLPGIWKEKGTHLTSLPGLFSSMAGIQQWQTPPNAPLFERHGGLGALFTRDHALKIPSKESIFT